MRIGEYECQTTFLMDFQIANAFGKEAIIETYEMASKGWIHDVVYMTELTIVLNYYCWYFYQKNDEYSKLYADLYYKCRDLCLDTFKGDDFQYFWEKTD